MRAMTCAAAALMVAFTLACKDRDRTETVSRTDNTADRVDNAADRVDNAAEEAGEEVREGARDAGNAAEKAADDASDKVRESSYDRRDEFRREVRERLAAMDKELTGLEGDLKQGASETRVKAVAAARDARRAAQRNVDRLGSATAANWEKLKREVSGSLDLTERQLRALRPDAKPMEEPAARADGGTDRREGGVPAAGVTSGLASRGERRRRYDLRAPQCPPFMRRAATMGGRRGVH